MPDRSSSPDEPRWGPASTHHVSPRRRPAAPRRRPAGTGERSSNTADQAPKPAATPSGAYPWESPARDDVVDSHLDDGYDEPVYSEPRSHGRAGYPGALGSPPRRRRGRKRWLILVPLLLAIALVLYPLTLGTTAMNAMHRVDALPKDSAGGGASGRNILVVGTDSRAGTDGLGKLESTRADTIMLLHVPMTGPSTLVSIPRDSYVEIPGHRKNKINAAYALGGPKLLTQSVEQLSGIRIDDYVETGLGGFGNVVDAVGGVTICPKRDMNDKDAHLNITKGCQTANGATALGYARARHSDPEGDLGRVKRQREVLAAIVKKAASPGTLLNPFNAYPLAKAGGAALTGDEGTGWFGVLRFLQGMRSVSGTDGISLTVPVADPSVRTRNAGLVVDLDDDQTAALFKALRDGDNDTVKKMADEQKA